MSLSSSLSVRVGQHPSTKIRIHLDQTWSNMMRWTNPPDREIHPWVACSLFVCQVRPVPVRPVQENSVGDRLETIRGTSSQCKCQPKKYVLLVEEARLGGKSMDSSECTDETCGPEWCFCAEEWQEAEVCQWLLEVFQAPKAEPFGDPTKFSNLSVVVVIHTWFVRLYLCGIP